jgi:hypothetical protein
MSHRRHPASRASLLALGGVRRAAGCLGGRDTALAEGTGTPWWRVTSTTAPTNLPPGGEGQILLTAIDVGDGEVNATGDRVTVTDNLPPGLEATPSGARGSAESLLEGASTDLEPGLVTCETHPVSVTCTSEGPKPLIPFVPLEVAINMKVAEGGPSEALQWMSCWLLLIALGLDSDAGVGAAAAVLFAVNVTAVIPATPANVGVFQAACVAVLAGAYYVSTPEAIAYGIVLQAVEVAAALIMGLPALLNEGLSWRDVRLRTMLATPVKLGPRPAR